MEKEIKELSSLIQQEETKLYNTASKWRSNQNDVLQSWQRNLLRDFMRKKELIRTLMLENAAYSQEKNGKMPFREKAYIALSCSVATQNMLLKVHFDQLCEFFSCVETGKPISTAARQSAYLVLGKIMETSKLLNEEAEIWKHLETLIPAQ